MLKKLLMVSALAYAAWAFVGSQQSEEPTPCKLKQIANQYYQDMKWHPFDLLRVTVSAAEGDTIGMLQTVQKAFEVPPFTVGRGVAV